MTIEGDVPSPINPPKGCHIHPLPYAEARCRIEEPRQRWSRHVGDARLSRVRARSVR
jgi:ABC-type dipeptide/oligopeptide/nickel transport system ATPase component